MASTGWLFASLRGFQGTWLRGDIAAATTLAAIAIPEQLATAHLSGMPPASGLVAFAAGSVAFAAFGSHRFLSVGADSTIAPIMAASLVGIAAAGTAPYAGMAAVLALMVGVLLIFASVLRLGWIAELLSIPVTTGVLAGIAVHIIVGQLPAVLGLEAPAGSLLQQSVAIVRQIPQTQAAGLAIGLGVLATSLLAERIDHRLPGPLIGLAVSTYAVWQFGLQDAGVPTLGALPLAVPLTTLALPGWGTVVYLLPLALIVTLTCMIQTAAVIQSFPPSAGRQQNVNREFAAVGAGSILAALLGAFAVNASPPRTAAAGNAGARSQLCGLLAVVLVTAAVLSAGGAFAFIPHAALGGVLIFIGLRILRFPLMRQILRRSPHEVLLVAAAAALVVVMPIDIGISMSIVLSLLHSIYIIARPRCSVLARVPGTTIWWSLTKEETGEQLPGVLVFAFGAPVNFMNARYLVARMMEAIAARAQPCRLVVIEANGVIDIDFTGSQILQQAVAELQRRHIVVALARMESERAQEAAQRTGLIDAVGRKRVFRSVEDAVRSCAAA